MTLTERVEQALENTGIPRAGVQQRGWHVEHSRSSVRLYWGYGEPIEKSREARNFLGQCSLVLAQAGFTMREPAKDASTCIEILS